MVQLDLLKQMPSTLPDEAELRQLFSHLNAELFKSKLPQATVCWSTRMRIAGTCHRQRALITLSRPYHEQYPEDIDDTLKHEMIHLRYAGHGPAFRKMAARVGASLHCREYDGIHPRARLVYACPTCWREYRRMKPAQLYCGRCARGRLHPQFRLVLKRVLRPTDVSQRRTSKTSPSKGSVRRWGARRRKPEQMALLPLFDHSNQGERLDWALHCG